MADKSLACSYNRHLPGKIGNTFFLASVVNAVLGAFFICDYLVCWGHVVTANCFSCLAPSTFFFLQMYPLVFVNESFLCGVEKIIVYIPTQNKAKIQTA